MKKWRHAAVLLRIPFSVYLMPVFWFALLPIQPHEATWIGVIGVFIVVHLFLYPASNGYNSYCDKDEGPIGGLEKPPPANGQLWFLSSAFDLIALILGFWINWIFGIGILVFTLVSKAYSWPKIRLKKYPIIAALTVSAFQGFIAYFTIQSGFTGEIGTSTHNLLLAICSSVFLAGSYPLTQLYQHKEDAQRGDVSLSMLLGVEGTFRFSALMFSLGALLLFIGLWMWGVWYVFPVFLVTTTPVTILFVRWWKACSQDPIHAGFAQAMRMNKVSSICMSLAFIAIREILIFWK
ncbi:MAG: UbiA family prenyltransferase [Bacteroidetes bacterium]|nr:UbiA family prenyltransferase [Bacteroidota bacterium]